MNKNDVMKFYLNCRVLLDFDKCKTKEDVENVFAGKKDEIAALNTLKKRLSDENPVV